MKKLVCFEQDLIFFFFDKATDKAEGQDIMCQPYILFMFERGNCFIVCLFVVNIKVLFKT